MILHIQSLKKHKSGVALPASEDTVHILGILSSMLSKLSPDSPSRIRLLAKFVEADYEKVDRLAELRDSAQSRLRSVDAEIETEKKAGVNYFPTIVPFFMLTSTGARL
jgi:beta-catenin-like protein 1